MMEPAEAGVSTPRAFLRVGGVSLARHQLGLALAMDCQRVICLARDMAADLIALQHEAERAGARFHVISGARGLSGLITANDDLLVFGDGLLIDPQQATALLERGHTVLVQPVEAGVAAGFERIDLNYASAGAQRIPGRLVDRLAELPADCDVQSSLTRIALQAGIPMQEAPAAAREGARWRLIRSEAEAHAAEHDWIKLHVGERRTPTLSGLLARLGLSAFGPSLLHAGSGSKVGALGALSAILLGLGAGWFGFVMSGFVLTALGAVLREMGATLRHVERASVSLPPETISLEGALGWLIDLALLLLVVWNVPLMPWESGAERAFAPLMLIMLVRLVPRIFDRNWAPWVEDRALLALLLAGAAAGDLLSEAVQLLAVLLAVAGLLLPGGKLRLT